jgi:hypothetical protein
LDDEGRRLLAIFEALRAEETAAARLISSPSRSVLYPEHVKMVEALEDLRFRCSEALFAFRMYWKKMRGGAGRPGG